MSSVATKVLATVNAPYGAGLSAHQLAAKIAAPESASFVDASVFAFFSEVKPSLQKAFIEEMGVDPALVHAVASLLAKKSGFELALAA